MAGAANLDFSQAIFVHREADDTCLTVIFHDFCMYSEPFRADYDQRDRVLGRRASHRASQCGG